MRHRSSWIRYGLARLRPLGRPVFWTPAIALLFLVLFTWEFFNRSESQSDFGRLTANETLSREDQAIGADIDSVSLLMNDIKASEKPQTLLPAIEPINPTSTQSNPAVPNRLFSAPANENTAQSASDQAAFNESATELSLSTTAPLPPNRLQEALTKLATENPSIVSQTPIEGTIHTPKPTSSTTPQLVNSFSAIVEGVQPIAPGTTPIVSAPLPIEPVNAPSPQPVEPSKFGVIENAPIVNQQPFTVPRSIPGRAIGGGNFNTFSNP